MKTAEEVLRPYLETVLRHTKVVEEDNALLAMKQYADQFRGLQWIDIKERKPADYQNVLFYDNRKGGGVTKGYFVDRIPDYVTHWMEEPAKP